jgi:hypothetical protein
MTARCEFQKYLETLNAGFRLLWSVIAELDGEDMPAAMDIKYIDVRFELERRHYPPDLNWRAMGF